MPVATTTIGAYPKPDFLAVGDWFDADHGPDSTEPTVILGVVAIAKSRLETADEIAGRLAGALEHIDRDRLVAAPDCGLGLLGRDLARAKLKNLCAAARSVP